MCGIAGIYYFQRLNENRKIEYTVECLLEKIVHRGPDDQGLVCYNDFGMGMRRLSIIDLEGGHQPIFDQESRYSITFNGEIYNYKQVKHRLEKQGVRFRSQSDTEVILLGFLKQGPEILNQLEGMFAFAIYDSRDHKLMLARDRLGKKPLYYFIDDEKLIFCSETHAIMSISGLNLSVNQQSYWDYLTFRYVSSLETVVNGIKKLSRGVYADISEEKIKEKVYWKIPTLADSENSDYLSPVEEFAYLFSKSVKKRLVADVPVGVVLSGGLDSCAVLHEAQKNQSIDSFHVYFKDGDNYNELKYAQMMADQCGSKLITVEANAEKFDNMLQNLSFITDEPLSDLASIPFKFVCDLARKDVKVVLSGEGSDEVLAGYGFNFIYRRLQLLKILQRFPNISRALGRVAAGMLKRNLAILDELSIPLKSWPKQTCFNISNQIDQSAKLKLCGNSKNYFKDSERFLNNAYNSVASEDQLNQMLHVISGDWLVENVLMKSDKVSMSSSLEVRCPFLDHHLVEFLFQLPGKLKVGFQGRRLESKILLRKYLKGKIPQEILTRKKLGFPVPAYALKGKKYKDLVFDVLNSENCYFQCIFDKKQILQFFDNVVQSSDKNETKEKHFLWSLVTFEMWHRRNDKYLSG